MINEIAGGRWKRWSSPIEGECLGPLLSSADWLWLLFSASTTNEPNLWKLCHAEEDKFGQIMSSFRKIINRDDQRGLKPLHLPACLHHLTNLPFSHSSTAIKSIEANNTTQACVCKWKCTMSLLSNVPTVYSSKVIDSQNALCMSCPYFYHIGHLFPPAIVGRRNEMTLQTLIYSWGQ